MRVAKRSARGRSWVTIDDGHAEGVLNFAEEEQDLLAGGGVEIAGGLVGEEDGGLVYESAGQSAALLLAAGEFAGSMVMAGAEADAVEGLRYAMACARRDRFRRGGAGSSTFSASVIRGRRLKDWKTMPTVSRR